MASCKGTIAVNEKFWIVVILLAMVFLLAVWLLLNQFFVDYVTEHINSEIQICETFETVPGIGSLAGCPG